MERRKSVLILGGGVMQLPALRICRRRGWRVAVAGREIIGEARALADQAVQVDLSDPEAVLQEARDIRLSHGLDGVFTAGTDFSTTVAEVAAALGLPGLPPAVARAATDKVRMRALFREHGLPSPAFIPLERVEDCAAVMDALPFPLVVKPVDSMGARAVRRVDSPGELEAAAAEALAASRSGRAIAEEYLEGQELSVDAIVHRGRITICGVADRHICFPPFFVEMGHTMPTGLDERLVEQAVAVFRRGVKALGIRDGAAKGDLRITAKGPFIGEIAARLSGGYMSGWTFPLASGVEVTAAALDIAVGRPPGGLKPRRSWVSSERAFISIPGVVAAVESLPEIDREEGEAGVRELFQRAFPGDRVVFPVNNMQKCGNVVAAAPGRAEAVRLSEQAARSIFVRLRPDVAETERWLASTGSRQPFAFRLSSPRNRRFLEDLAPWQGDLRLLGRDPQRVSIIALPDPEAEECRDWHGTTLPEALREVERRTGVGPRPAPARAPAAVSGELRLGRVFWEAFLKGGAQGGVYRIESLFAAGNRSAP